mgnify:CR=1 FL=1
MSSLSALGESVRTELAAQNERIEEVTSRKDAAQAAQKTAEDSLRAKRSLMEAICLDFDTIDSLMEAVDAPTLKKWKDAYDQFVAIGGDVGLAAAAPYRPRELSDHEKAVEAYIQMLTDNNITAGSLYTSKWEGVMHSMVRVADVPYPLQPDMVNCELVVVLGNKSNFIPVSIPKAKARFTLVTAANADEQTACVGAPTNIDKIWLSDKETYASERFRSDLTLMYTKETYASKVRNDTHNAVQAFIGGGVSAVRNGKKRKTAAVRNGKKRKTAAVSKGIYKDLSNAQIASRTGRDDLLATQRAASAGTGGNAAAANLFMGVMNSGRDDAVTGAGTSGAAGGSTDPMPAPEPTPALEPADPIPAPEEEEEEEEEVQFVGQTTAEERNAAGFASAIDLTEED